MGYVYKRHIIRIFKYTKYSSQSTHLYLLKLYENEFSQVVLSIEYCPTCEGTHIYIKTMR